MKNQVDFYAVYIKEAHPTDGWSSSGNKRVGIDISQAKSFEQRVDAAAQCCGALQMTIPLIVDGIDDRVAEAYSGFPDRLYVIDRNGKVAYKGGRGPFGFIPREMEQSLHLLLLDEAMQTEASAANSPAAN